jgi:hypothetical protein
VTYQFPVCLNSLYIKKKESEQVILLKVFPSENTVKRSHLLNKEELDDLIRELQLPKSKTEFLPSCLKEWGFLLPSCKIYKYRIRHEEFSPFFQIEEFVS